MAEKHNQFSLWYTLDRPPESEVSGDMTLHMAKFRYVTKDRTKLQSLDCKFLNLTTVPLTIEPL